MSNKNDKKTEELITQELNRNTEIMTEEISTKHRKWKRWYKVVGALACVVVFCTTYLLVLPVITMEKPTYCGYETHTHTAECYLEESQLICGSEEQIGHAHASECYNELEELVCGQAESEGHEHTEECYTTNSTLVCSMEEHNHRIQCQSDYEADVETLEQWEQTLPNKDDLKDKTISERISLVAKSQTGYSESRDNFIVLDDDAETISGYTRYGEWYNGVKDPSDITDYRYKEWPSLFTLFCLNYGGVAIKDIDWNIDYNQWIPDLMNNHPELLQETTTYNPVVGDVVFIHNQDDTYKSGVITEISANQITVLSGDQKENGQDKVKAFKLSLSDENIVFYLSFAEASEESENYEELESKKNDIQSEVSEEKDCIEEITPKDLKIGGNWIEDSYDSVAMTKAGRSSQHYDTSIAMMSVKESVPVDASQYLTGYTVKWHEVHDSSVTGSLPWKELKENEPIPANAHLRFEMQYGNLSPKAVQAGNYKMVLKIDSYIKNLMASGNILMAGEPRGTITATENEIILEFDHDWIDALVANNNKVSDDNKQSILGDFYFQGEMELDKIDQNGGLSFQLGDLKISIPAEGDAISKYADMDVKKVGAAQLIYDEADGIWYLEYEITVTAGPFGIPDASIVDKLTIPNNKNYLPNYPYVGVTTEPTTATTGAGASAADKPVEKQVGGTMAASHQTGTVYLNSDGNMVWKLGDLGANESRTLTYRVKVNDSYVGIPHTRQDTITNTAEAWSKTNPHGQEVVNYTPKATGSVQKRGKNYRPGDGTKGEDSKKWYADYTVKVTADSNNSYPLTNVKLRDDLDSPKNNGYRHLINYIQDSIKVYKDELLTTPVSKEELHKYYTDYHTSPSRSGYTGNNPFISTDGNAFEVYLGDLKPGESRWITYTMEVDVNQAQLIANGEVGFNNIAELWSDDVKTGGGLIAKDSTAYNISSQTWERKLEGGQLRQSEEIIMPEGSDIFDATGNTSDAESLPKLENPGQYTIPSGAYKYTVVVNEKGEWNVSSANLKDTLGENTGSDGKKHHYLKFTEYVQIDVYDKVKGANTQAGMDANLAGQTPKKSIWVKIDDQWSFSFKGTQIGLDDSDAYVLTYYAVPTSDYGPSYGNAYVKNSFSISGTVSYGGNEYQLQGISTQVTSSVKEPGVNDPKKVAWYYDKEDQTFVKYHNGNSNGAFYWVIKLSGDKIPKGMMFEESTRVENKNYKHYLRNNESLIGFYTIGFDSGTDDKTNANEFLNTYANINEFLADAEKNDKINRVDSSIYSSEWKGFTDTGFGNNGQHFDLRLTFNQDYAIKPGEALYLIVRTDPVTMPGDGQVITYQNKCNFKNPSMENAKWLNTLASQTLTGPRGSLDKTFEGLFKVMNEGAAFSRYDNNQQKFVDYPEATKPGVTNAVLQARMLCVGQNNSDFHYITKDANYDPGKSYNYEDGLYVVWNLTLNKAGTMANGGPYTIVDTLPDGLELAYARLSYINFNQVTSARYPGANWSGTNRPENIIAISNPEWKEDPEWQEYRSQASVKGSNTNMGWNRFGTYYYTNGKQVKFYIPQIYGTSTSGGDRIEFQVVCRVTDPEVYFTDVTFNNTASLYNADGHVVEADSASATVSTPGLTKELVAKLGSSGQLQSAVLPYELVLNDLAADMDTSGDTISVDLLDHMSNNLSINMDTMRIYIDAVADENLIYSGDSRQMPKEVTQLNSTSASALQIYDKDGKALTVNVKKEDGSIKEENWKLDEYGELVYDSDNQEVYVWIQGKNGTLQSVQLTNPRTDKTGEPVVASDSNVQKVWIREDVYIGNTDKEITHPHTNADGTPGAATTSKPNIRISMEKYFDDQGTDDGSEVMRISNLPDNHKIIIRYSVSANLSSMSGANNSFSNVANWDGYAPPAAGEEIKDNMVFEAAATAQTKQHGAVKITKHAGENESILLNGAEFTLYRAEYIQHTADMLVWTDEEAAGDLKVDGEIPQEIKSKRYAAVYDSKEEEVKVLRDADGNLEAWWDTTSNSWNTAFTSTQFHHKFDTMLDGKEVGIKVYTDDPLDRRTTGVDGMPNGIVTYGLAGDENDIHFNKVYAIVETKAPEGYDLDPTPHFFVVPSTAPNIKGGDYFYHADWPADVHVCTRGVNNTLTYFLDVFDYKGNAQVEKDFGGNTEIDPGVAAGTYQFGIWKASDVEEVVDGATTVIPKKLTKEHMVKPVVGYDNNHNPIYGNPVIGTISYTESDFGSYVDESGEEVFGVLPQHRKTYVFKDLTFGEAYYIFELDRNMNAVLEGNLATMPNGYQFVANYDKNKIIPTKNEQGLPVTPKLTVRNSQYEAEMTKKFLGISQNALSSAISGEYYFGIQKKNANGTWGRVLTEKTQTIKVTLENARPEYVLTFTGLEKNATYRIVELDSATGTIPKNNGDKIRGESGIEFTVGYEGSPEFTVSDNQTENVVITNSFSSALPHTGGVGTMWYRLSGALLIAIAFIGYYVYLTRHRYERRYR